MRIIAVVSLLCLISESTSECPTEWHNIHCGCFNDVSNPVISCVVSNESELIVLSNIHRRNLTVLYLRLHGFTVLPSSVLHYENLITLLIYAKNLTAVNDDAFVDLEESLSSLTISYSLLSKIPVSATSRLQKLTNLNMERNKIISLNESLRSIPLRALNLRRNRISDIRCDVLPESLVHLDLAYNKLKSLNGALKGNLISLDISHNEISSLDSELNEVPKLENIMARYNEIHDIEHCFSRVRQVETILLHFNLIKEIHNGLHGLIKLRTLGLRFNRLEVIDRTAFVDLKALETLSLSFNRLEYLDDDLFSCQINLRHLDISFNDLKDLDFLVSREALTGQAPGVDEICSFRHNSTLLSLNMESSGIRCRRKTRPAIRYLLSKGVKIAKNPCRRKGQQL